MVQVRSRLVKRLPLLALGLALTLSALLYLGDAVRINRLSLQYAGASQDARPSPPGAHPRAGYWQALQALDDGDGQAALALLEPLAAGGDPLALQAMGKAYESLGDLSAAIQIWEQTRNEYALYQVAEAAARAGDLDTAQEAYSAAWVLNPGGDSTAKLAIFLSSGKGDPAAAEAVLRWSLTNVRFSGKHASWHLILARLLEPQGRWPEAIESYRQFIAKSPGHDKLSKVYYELSWVYHRAGRPGEAVAAIEQALTLEAANPNYLLRAGQIYGVAGEVDKALAAYRQVLALQPGNEDALEAVKRLTHGQ
jgi:tetratricopeptide (TPR) repeat protein